MIDNEPSCNHHLAMKRFAYQAALLALAMAHLGLLVYFERTSLIFGSEPVSWLDFDTHAEQTWKAVEVMDTWGKSWAYDPFLLAGNPSGAIFEADNKGWELWTFVLWKAGVPKAVAFNLFIVLAHLGD